MTTETVTPTPTVTAELSLATTKERLLAAVTFVGGAVAKRAPIPILSHLSLEPGRIRAFDYETSACERLGVTGYGAVALNADTLTKMVKSLDKGATVNIVAREMSTTRERTNRQWINNEWVESVETYRDHEVTATLTSGTVTFDVPCMSAEDTPALPDVTDATFGFTAEASDLYNIVKRAAITAGVDDTLPVLTGALVEIAAGGITVASTNRYRLSAQAFTPTTAGDDGKLLLPVKPAVWALKNLSGVVDVRYTDGIAVLSTDDRTVTLRTLDGEFPRYRSLIPESFESSVTFSVADITKAVKRMALSLSRTAPVVLAITGDGVTVFGDKSSERIPATLDGPEVEAVGYNVDYLLDGVAFDGAATVTLSLTSPLKPAVITGTRDGSRYLIMPVRLAEASA